MVTHSSSTTNGRVLSDDEHYGRFFGLFSLTGETEGVLSVFMRLRKQKHYSLYERRSFPNSAQAGRYLAGMEKTARMFVVRNEFE